MRAASTLIASTRATCNASRPAPSPIWCRQEVIYAGFLAVTFQELESIMIPSGR